jgi:hypothetical protein
MAKGPIIPIDVPKPGLVEDKPGRGILPRSGARQDGQPDEDDTPGEEPPRKSGEGPPVPRNTKR